MSATNRSAVRHPDDLYETPEWLTQAIVPVLRQYLTYHILEPACGNGAIVKVLKENFLYSTIVSGDINQGYDFLTTQPESFYDVIITNPPYSLAMEFIEHSFRFCPYAVVMLLRLNFLGSQRRAKWLRRHTPSVYVSPRRPSFTNNGTDATEYAWFVWDDRPPTVAILPTEL